MLLAFCRHFSTLCHGSFFWAVQRFARYDLSSSCSAEGFFLCQVLAKIAQHEGHEEATTTLHFLRVLFSFIGPSPHRPVLSCDPPLPGPQNSFISCRKRHVQGVRRGEGFWRGGGTTKEMKGISFKNVGQKLARKSRIACMARKCHGNSPFCSKMAQRAPQDPPNWTPSRSGLRLSFSFLPFSPVWFLQLSEAPVLP